VVLGFFPQISKIELCTKNRPVFLVFVVFVKTGGDRFSTAYRYFNPWLRDLFSYKSLKVQIHILIKLFFSFCIQTITFINWNAVLGPSDYFFNILCLSL
jgi:hypothetical protein